MDQKRESIPQPFNKDYLFNMDWMEEYGLLFQESICSYILALPKSLDACTKLLTIKDLPEEMRKQAARTNLSTCQTHGKRK